MALRYGCCEQRTRARESAVTWTDASGNLWLFGGEGYDSTGKEGILNDLWKYSAGPMGVDGRMERNRRGRNLRNPGYDCCEQGTWGAREPVTWTDASGNLWLFGGEG